MEVDEAGKEGMRRTTGMRHKEKQQIFTAWYQEEYMNQDGVKGVLKEAREAVEK